MVVIHGRAKRKPTGGRITSAFTKRVAQRGSKPTHTKIGTRKAVVDRMKGGKDKIRLLSTNKVNLYDPSVKKYSVDEIKTVSDNLADRHFVRHNILTKGAIIMTSKGKARVTNRPGQEGVVNAILVK
jgi:small subunit ribosomal protein S8e